MPRIVKYDDCEYETPKYFTKIFMYNAPNFKNIGPIVEIIRNLERSIISFKYGKFQETIKTYGTQYYHLVTGLELKNQKDYLILINAMIRFIFIFNNSDDNTATNLMNLAEKHKKCVICYSEIDSKYHFYDSTFEKTEYSTAIEVINRMKEINDFLLFEKVVELFPDLDIIPEPENKTSGSLERCIEILRVQKMEEEIKKEKNKIKVVPPSRHAAFISKKMFREKPPKFEEPVPVKKNLLSEFFKKK
jgi:hypothetical protein